jgi:hypothetical protein
MNNLGYSNDNLHIGDVRVKGQGETLIIGNENGGDGYILPTEKGTTGQVITQNADNTTSFKDIGGGGGSVRVWTNSYSILTNPTFGGGVGIPINIDSSGSGSKNYTDVNFPVGSQLHIQACGSWNINNPSGSCDGQFVLAVGGGGFTITDVFNLVSSGTIINEVDTGLGFWSVDINIVRITTSTIRLGRVAVNSRLTNTSNINVPIVNDITNNPNGFTVGVPAFPFDINLQWIDQSGGSSQCFPVAGTYNHNVINANDTLITTTNPSLDHNTLSNLTTGDAHTQYAKLNGRSGGQVLSGGITPANFLTLKSHTAGLNNMIVKDLNTSFEKNIDMNNNNINNVLNINSASSIILNPAVASSVNINGNVDMGGNNIIGVSSVVGDGSDLTIRNGGGESILLNSATNTIDILNNDLNMNTNDILNAGDVALTSINTNIIYVADGTMPISFVANITYIFVGSRSTATSFTLPANCKICGTGKNNSFINYTGATSLFISTDNNLSICDITLTSSDNAGRILSAINLGQDKTIDMTKVQLRNCKNGMTIVGYDLVDLNNCIFTFFESGSLTPIGINFNENSKVQLSSCEFLRWFQEGGTPASTFFNGIMLKFAGALNALNINGCFFHPQYDQDGINLSALLSALEGTITSNTFIDINLNTPTFQVLVPPIASLASKYVIESNSIYPNLKSQVTYVLSAVNTVATDLSVNNPNVINHNNLALPLAIQFATIGTNGLITYTKKRSANFMIVATCNVELVSGINNRIGLGLFVNGAEVPLAYSYVNLSASGSANQKSVTLSFTGQANLNDTFQLSIFNSTASNNVLVDDINFAGIEI